MYGNVVWSPVPQGCSTDGVPLGAMQFPTRPVGGYNLYKGRGGTKEKGEGRANCVVCQWWFGREM